MHNPQEGMTLRDYFAAKAMQGFAAYIGPSMTFESRAKTAYEWADAMLKAREAWTHKNLDAKQDSFTTTS